MSDETTELRAKLTERGIEYTTNDHMGACETSWNGFTAMQLTPSAKLIMAVTPEQAIAATLGRETLTAEQVRDVIERHSMWVNGNNRCFHNGAYEEIADELNAHVGRTCEACAFSKPTDLTDGCAALERIAELEEECDQLRKAVDYWQRMYEEQIGVRR